MLERIPLITKNILIINVLLFIATQAIPSLDYYFSGYPFMSESFKFWQVITHMFMHGNLSHIFMNMFGVFMFGSILEKYWGPKKFLNFYLLCGLGAFALHQTINYFEYQKLMATLPKDLIKEVLRDGHAAAMQHKNYINPSMAALNTSINGGVVGASGCVFGLLIGYGVMFPNQELMMLFLPIPIKAKYFVLGYGVIELFFAFQNRPDDNVAHFAHIGGMLIGFIILKIWQSQGKLYS
jgi:membrane associated rhomboid family serine protease